jgi:hypothetical protein
MLNLVPHGSQGLGAINGYIAGARTFRVNGFISAIIITVDGTEN